MAGFVLVPLAALLVLSIFLVIEKGKVHNALPVDRTGTFWLLPLEDAEDPADLVHCEVPPWAWVDQDWATQMDAAAASEDRDERFAVLMAAHAAVDSALKGLSGLVDDQARADAWAGYDDAAAQVVAARAGWKWACRTVETPYGRRPSRRDFFESVPTGADRY